MGRPRASRSHRGRGIGLSPPVRRCVARPYATPSSTRSPPAPRSAVAVGGAPKSPPGPGRPCRACRGRAGDRSSRRWSPGEARTLEAGPGADEHQGQPVPAARSTPHRDSPWGDGSRARHHPGEADPPGNWRSRRSKSRPSSPLAIAPGARARRLFGSRAGPARSAETPRSVLHREGIDAPARKRKAGHEVVGEPVPPG